MHVLRNTAGRSSNGYASSTTNIAWYYFNLINISGKNELLLLFLIQTSFQWKLNNISSVF